MWAAPITVEGPEASALSLDTAKEFLRIGADDTYFDIEIEGWIAGVIDEAEAITGTRFISQNVELRGDSFADLERLPIGPVREVTAIAYRDAGGEWQDLDSAMFELDGAGLQHRIIATSSWPAIAPRPGLVRVTARVGYGDSPANIPPAITVAMLRAVRAHFDDNPIELAPLLNNHRIWL